MADQKRFDIIIAGAGAAGLSLLWRIMNSPALRNQKVLLIDQSFKPVNDKTWCFWEDLQIPHDDLIHHSWKKLLVRFREETYSEPLKKFQYQCLRSDDFSRFILQQARKNEHVTFLQAAIQSFNSHHEYGVVHTSEGIFESKKVFQSVLNPPEFRKREVDVSLIQHFLGWEIRSKKNLFDPTIATFMDFNVPWEDGISFIYLLPFSKTNALVEYTIFSKNIADKDLYKTRIENYLSTTYHVNKKEYSIHREEFGTIPMDDRKYPAWYCRHVLNIGTVAGLPKPSTGYTFSRIQKHSAQIVRALQNGEELPGSPVSSYRFRVYDLMMLYLLKKEPEHALEAFHRLFKKNQFDRVLEFLSEQTNPLEELTIFSRMPVQPFLRSIYKLKHQIFTEA